MLDWLDAPALVALVGFGGGLLLGLAARIGRFCTLGAIEDLFYGDSDIRLRMWGVAIGVAVLGVFGLGAAGVLAPADFFYVSEGWNPLGQIIGGLVFGYGMALAGNCGYGALARLGGGDLRAFVIVLVMAVSAYAFLSGPFAHLRVTLFPTDQLSTEAPAGFAHLIGGTAGMSPDIIGMIIGATLLIAALASRAMRNARKEVFWGAMVGVAIVTGWWGSSAVFEVSFGDTSISSHSFAEPLGDTVLYTMLASGMRLNFGVGSVVGVLAGAFAGSLIKGHFRWEACEDPRELRRQIGGAAMMGAGAAVSVGCSVGQGISAFSVLAYSAPVTLAAILAGTALGLRHLIHGFAPS